MKTKTHLNIIIGLVLLSLIIYSIGLNWGLPSQKLNKLYFYEKSSLENLTTLIEKYPVEEAWKGWGSYVVKHPEEEEGKLPRSFYNPIRSYHPDEYAIIKILSYMHPEKNDFNPHAYSIGGTYIYLIGLLIFLLSKVGFISLVKDLGFYFFNPEEIAKFYIVGRVVTAIYGVGIILLSYLLFKKVFKSKCGGFLSSLLILFSPLMILNSHYMYVDVPALFWVVATLFVTTKFIEKFSFNKVFLAGIFSGLACGTKISLIVSLAIPILGIFLIPRNFKKILKSNGLVIGGFLLSFFITNPYFFLTFPEPLIELGQHTSVVFNGIFYLSSLKYGLGLPLFVFCLIGIIFNLFLIKRKENFEKNIFILFLCWMLFFFIFISIFSKNFARYTLPIIPSFIILGMSGWLWLLSKKTKSFQRFIISSVIVLVLLFTFVYGMSYEMLFLHKNVRTQAGEWIKQNIEKQATIGVTEVPWQFQMPPFDYQGYRVIVTGYDLENLIKESPQYFIVSSFQTKIVPYPLKLGEKKLMFWEDFQKANLYKPVKKCQRFPSFLGLNFKSKTMPEDLIYLNPTIIIFKKIKK